MRTRNKVIAAAAAALALAGAGATAVGAGASSGDSEAPITGSALDRARAVALDTMGGGQVTGTEVGDEDSYYEVEVTTEDGRQVDVQLDRDFHVVSSGPDIEGPESEDGD